MARFRDLVGRALQLGLDVLDSRSAGTPSPPRRPGRGAVRSVPAGDRARRVAYAPDLDGAADPGEIVWTWVPFEDDPDRGKDRPVLVVAHGDEDGSLLGLMLSSQGHRADDAGWLGIGSGPWDREGRDSYVRLDRVLEVPEHGIRREGAVMPVERFDRVADVLRRDHGWT